MQRVPTFVLLLALWALPQRAHAFFGAVWGYVKQYQLGIDYTNSNDNVSASYRTAGQTSGTDGCVNEDETTRRCGVRMTGGASSGPGIFLQQAFKRQGKFYFKPDVGFGARYLNGRLEEAAVEEQKAAGLPLESMSFSLVALIVKPYIQFGITPAAKWPDLLISLGPAAQVALGRVSVNDKDEYTAMATSSGYVDGFFELELVFVRFGDGAFSAFTSRDATGGGTIGTKFFPKSVDGMDDIRAGFNRQLDGDYFSLGLKLVLNFP